MQEMILQRTNKNGEEVIKKLRYKLKEFKPSEEQRAIIYEQPQIPMRLIACAGAGKTTTLIQRLLHLIMDKEQSGIMYFTFNAQAGDDVNDKLKQALGLSKAGFDEWKKTHNIVINNINKV